MQIHLFSLFLTLFLLSLRFQFSRFSPFNFLHFSRWYISIIDVSLSGFPFLHSLSFLPLYLPFLPIFLTIFLFFLFRFPFFSSLPFLLPLLTRPRATISQKSAILFPPFYLFLCSPLLFLHRASHSSFFTLASPLFCLSSSLFILPSILSFSLVSIRTKAVN